MLKIRIDWKDLAVASGLMFVGYIMGGHIGVLISGISQIGWEIYRTYREAQLRRKWIKPILKRVESAN